VRNGGGKVLQDALEAVVDDSQRRHRISGPTTTVDTTMGICLTRSTWTARQRHLPEHYGPGTVEG
jgi:hypothetical protein